MSNAFGLSKLKVYPSGFLGAAQDPVLIRNKRSSDNVSLTYDTSIFDPEKEDLVIANQDIDRLYRMLARDDLRSSNFDFREEALRVILRCFGVSTFNDWVFNQFSSPMFTKTHMDFIDDCIKFMRTGRRSMPTTTWSAIISGIESPKVIELSETIKSYFNVAKIHQIPDSRRIDIPELVADWMRRPRGFDDLLETCHLMYGVSDNI